jgi:hypothetical protein
MGSLWQEAALTFDACPERGSIMKIMNRLFATAFVALLIIASHSRAEPEEVAQAVPACEAGEAESDCQ